MEIPQEVIENRTETFASNTSMGFSVKCDKALGVLSLIAVKNPSQRRDPTEPDSDRNQFRRTGSEENYRLGRDAKL
jgi:hypothetical protein